MPVVPAVMDAIDALIAPGGSVFLSARGHRVFRHAVLTAKRGLAVDLTRVTQTERVTLVHAHQVSAFERRLRAWLLPFRGVATRYLHRYLAWHRFADRDELQVWFGSLVADVVRLRAGDAK